MTFTQWIVTAGVGAFVTLAGFLYKLYRDERRRPGEEIDQAINQFKEVMGGTVAVLKDENTRQAGMIKEQRELINQQSHQIEELEGENEKLAGHIRNLSIQNMESGQREKRLSEKYEDLMRVHNEFIGRMKERGHDVA